MSRMYSLVFGSAGSPVAVSAVQDLFSIIPGDDNPILIHGCFISAANDDVVGDANEDIVGIDLVVGHLTTGSGGSTPTANPLDKADAACAATASNIGANDTSTMTGGTAVVLHSEGFNIRVGWSYVPTPEMRILVPGSIGFQVELVTAPAAPVDLVGTLIFEEF